MSRIRRQTSSTHLYHVILRGINQQVLFEDTADYVSFLTMLGKCKKQDHFLIHAYCLMDNHVHLLLQENDVPLHVLMSRLEVCFARWYNQKYDRSGYLFQDRFKSSPVDNGQYLLNVFRYIHQNPYHAGLERKVGTYSWSSFNDYRYEYDSFVERKLLCAQFPSREELLCYLQTPVREKQMEYFSWNRIPDREVLHLISEIAGSSGPGEFQRLDLVTRDKYLGELLDYKISIRQLSRLTGVSKAAIEKISRQKGH